MIFKDRICIIKTIKEFVVKKFEYILDVNSEFVKFTSEKKENRNISLEQYFNMLGQQGWEIISRDNAKPWFAKREITPEMEVSRANNYKNGNDLYGFSR